MKKFFKKLITSMLVLSVMLSAFASSAYAADIIESETVVLGGDSIERDELFISSELAQEIAALFISDMINMGEVTWDASTDIVDVVTMYDGTDEHNITAYTIELDEGYVVISAYVDVPNVVLEWSDEAMPLYQEFDLDETDEIVYGGSLYYYKDGGNGKLETLTGLTVERSEVINVLETKYDIANVPETILSALVDDNSASVMTTTPGSSGAITDPIAHADQWYNGPYSCNDYQNHWEEDGTSVECHKTSEYSGYQNHCGPTAVTNMLIIYGNRFEIDSITSQSHTSIFSTVAQIGISNLYYINSDLFNVIGGTANALADNYILDAFDAYDVSGITIDGRFNTNYTNIEISLRNDRLLYLLLNNHDRYGDHHVVCYAYTRLVSSTDGSYVTYLKVADGWANSPRYIDLASVDGDEYWEVNY